jgi:Sec7 domain
MSKAALKFNFKPKNGINYLVSQKLISSAENYEQHVKDIVKFLKTTPVLGKT